MRRRLPGASTIPTADSGRLFMARTPRKQCVFHRITTIIPITTIRPASPTYYFIGDAIAIETQVKIRKILFYIYENSPSVNDKVIDNSSSFFT